MTTEPQIVYVVMERTSGSLDYAVRVRREDGAKFYWNGARVRSALLLDIAWKLEHEVWRLLPPQARTGRERIAVLSRTDAERLRSWMSMPNGALITSSGVIFESVENGQVMVRMQP